MITTTLIIKIIISALIAYLIGSIPTGYIIVKAFTGQDIRQVGSGSTGATNVKRVMGKKWFFIVMLLDALKGATPVSLATFIPYLHSNSGITAVLAAAFVLIGHSKSIFLGFTGGKSVASGVGIIALAISPLLMYLFKQPIAYIIYCIIGAIYVIYLHRENIKRLIAGNENKVR